MTVRKWVVRTVLVAGGLVVSLLLFTFLAVQYQQRALRWRAERLSADMHQIRLYESTWADAQRLMHRWGAWGHYNGRCTATSCKYSIEINGIDYYNRHALSHPWLYWLLQHDRLNLYQWFGGRGSAFLASFTVHNGTIWRQSAAFGVTVPRRRMKRITHADTILNFDDIDLTLSLDAVSYQRLHRTLENPFADVGLSDELAEHPYYEVGGPSGCMINCRMMIAYYSTHTPPAEIERLSSYDFSCFTRFDPCADLRDLLPAAKEWHLYNEDPLKLGPLPGRLCGVPAWALARDARYVLSVEALTGKQVRIIESLKQPPPWPIGAIVSAHTFAGYNYPPAEEDPEHLIPGKRFIVFPVGDDDRRQLLTKDSPINLERCGVQEDIPDIRRDLEKGFAQNDSLNP